MENNLPIKEAVQLFTNPRNIILGIAVLIIIFTALGFTLAKQTINSSSSPKLSSIEQDTKYISNLSRMSFTVPQGYGINITGGCEGGCTYTYEVKRQEGIALTGNPSQISITESRSEYSTVEEYVKNNINKFENPEEITFKNVRTLKYTNPGLFGIQTDYFLIKDGFAFHIQCLDEESDELVQTILKGIKL
ncbi:MAG: hypothetical protein CEO22_530 [Candidatus Berkelbacteria bacterium Gr01-1014_85]|uniref:Uncharacterized protein n=1 Tax=Candidatus Berkelbacteria bacterium Gr01-1014_85 TaxID=2017150 RepID=A0A554JAD0_9BACT|nr:MAG: hypothetical protein CEO22_530 [Candidatus Berkelbacteria bacterium Gr01-1014_85]